MGSSTDLDLENLHVILEQSSRFLEPEINPTPYTFTKLENGKKTIVDTNSIVPPSWLLLDHTIAVVWLLFSSSPALKQLNINDLKWAHEFLKDIKNSKGENPPDVKACLSQIQDRLIDLYARMTESKEDDYDNFTYRESIYEDSRSGQIFPRRIDSRQLDSISMYSSLSPSRTAIGLDYPMHRRYSCRGWNYPSQKRYGNNNTMKTFQVLSKNSNIFEEPENKSEEEVEKYLFSFFDDDNTETLHARSSSRSFIPMKKNHPSVTLSGIFNNNESIGDVNLKEKATKKINCVAELQSLQVQKSTKVNKSEEAEYSNLKAEFRQVRFNPLNSKAELKRLLAEWRQEQVGKLHNDIGKLKSIEEIMKSVKNDEALPNVG